MANAVVAAEASVPVPAPHMTPTWRERGAGAWRSHVVHQLKLRDAAQRDTFRDLIRFCESSFQFRHWSPGEKRSDQWPCEQLASVSTELRLFAAGPEAAADEDHRRFGLPGGSDAAKRQIQGAACGGAARQAAAAAAAAGRCGGLAPAAAAASPPPAAAQPLAQVPVRRAAPVPAPDRVQSAAAEACRSLQVRWQSQTTRVWSGESVARPRPRPRLLTACPSRSASARSSRFLLTLRELFRKRRGHSLSSLDQDLWRPLPGGLARVPARALHVLEAHEQGINAVRFCAGSAMLATGGTDRVVRVWEVSAGWLSHRRTLEGSTDGITCVDFDPAGWRVLAASYDKSALLWRLDDSAPQLTLTGHSRKVTSARFSSLHQVATGSADGTVRLWDLHRAACVQVADAASCCSDLLCCDRSFISGHFDGRVRVWDHRMSTVAQQFPALGKVTSLDVTPDHRQLLSCCRDDCLQLTDLRMQKPSSACFRAEGFSCGGDCTRAVLSPDGRFAAAGSADGAVYVWSVSRGGLETRLPDGHRSAVNAVSWSVSGEFVVSVDKSRQAVLWSHV
ncbi:protein Atg16l2-like isoform X3 [Synchiropus splendidus]|uniref:protein Atg16l2-like isoform X3 n=1 Tax=Synchiropus splendidus TaxID=270530 RepID=UPI00237D5ED5|nr:protein Atg16l2-like isoform X3 [Synchiropus splendidus]